MAPSRAARTYVLTPRDEKELVDYLIASNIARDGKSDADIRLKVVAILMARRAQNRRGGRAYIAFSNAAARVIAGGALSLTLPPLPPATKTWFYLSKPPTID